MPTHYDDNGHRATRQDSTTRAMADEEILTLLRQRGHERYADVAEQTADLMMGQLRVVNEDVLDRLDQLGELAQSLQAIKAGVEVPDWLEALWDRLLDLEDWIGQQPDRVDPADPLSMEQTLAALGSLRQQGLVLLAMRVDELSGEDVEAIEQVIHEELDPLRYQQNLRELGARRELFERARGDETAEIAGQVKAIVAARDGAEADTPRVQLRDLAERLTGHSPRT